MYVMTVTAPDGTKEKILASGWTPSECDVVRDAWIAKGYTVTFAMEVWR